MSKKMVKITCLVVAGIMGVTIILGGLATLGMLG